MAHLATTVLSEMEGVLEIQIYGDLLHVFVDSLEQREVEVVSKLGAAEVQYSGLRRTQPRMEEAFISLIKRQEKP
jgi:hypothetical protein